MTQWLRHQKWSYFIMVQNNSSPMPWRGQRLEKHLAVVLWSFQLWKWRSLRTNKAPLSAWIEDRQYFIMVQEVDSSCVMAYILSAGVEHCGSQGPRFLLLLFLFFFFLRFYLFYLFMRDTEREAETRADGKTGSLWGVRCRPHPRTLGSWPEPKADAQPLCHPGAPLLLLLLFFFFSSPSSPEPAVAQYTSLKWLFSASHNSSFLFLWTLHLKSCLVTCVNL